MKMNSFGNASGLMKQGLFLLLLLMLLMPEIQKRGQVLPSNPLRGAFAVVPQPDLNTLNWAGWIDGSFQQQMTDRIEANIGFRDWLVRLNNQLNYSLYSQVKAEGVVMGRNGEFFEEDYIKAYMGQFFVGKSAWEGKAARLKAVQDTLAALGKSLLVVFEPGKGSFYPERFPDNYANIAKGESNYDCFKDILAGKGVNVLDLNRFFVEQKQTAPYLLFPHTGTHWSYFGAALAVDTTLKYLRQLHGPAIPAMHLDSLMDFQGVRHPDDDIWLALNLLAPTPSQNLAYPVLRFDTLPEESKYKLLVAGDSFYFNWQSDGAMFHAFKNCDFWYYNSSVWGREGVETGKTANLDFRNEVIGRDIIMIMITERFTHNFAWNFDEQLFNLFYPNQLDPIEFFANRERMANDQFMRLVDEARASGISLEERIRGEAEFLLYEDHQKNPEKYTSRETMIPILMMSIRHTPEWLEKVKAKAEEKGLPLDEMIRLDATWIYENDFVPKLNAKKEKV